MKLLRLAGRRPRRGTRGPVFRPYHQGDAPWPSVPHQKSTKHITVAERARRAAADIDAIANAARGIEPAAWQFERPRI